jgi:SAM-dependent methyltransferase
MNFRSISIVTRSVCGTPRYLRHSDASGTFQVAGHESTAIESLTELGFVFNPFDMAIDPDFYDNELRRHNEHFRAAADVQPDDRVLDVGCGAGQSTRQAAHTAVDGSALGVDVSGPMLERARQLSDDEGLRNVSYQQADAETHSFPSARFDLCISRFGTMFFADPVAAFANIGRALRPGARLVILVWQSQRRNEWATAIDRSLGMGRPPTRPINRSGPFSLADPADTQAILADAGFSEVRFTEVHEPVFYGQDTGAAYNAVLSLWQAKDLLADLDSATTARALGQLRTTLAAHDTGNGVLFDSRAWIVTAVRQHRGGP